MRRVSVLLSVALLTVSPFAAAEEPTPGPTAPAPAPASPPAPAPAPTGGTSNSVVLPMNAHALSRVHAGLNAEPTRAAAAQRDVTVSAAATRPAERPAGPRPAPTPRALRKMSVERAMAAASPGLAACAVLNPTVAPLALSFRVSVAPSGEVESSELASQLSVPPALVVCATQAIGTVTFGSPGPNGALVGVPVTIPGRPASVPPPAAPAPSATPRRR